MKTLLPFVLLLTGFPLFAQVSSSEVLDGNKHHIPIASSGNLAFNGDSSYSEVPYGDSTRALFAGQLWIGGLVDSVAHTAVGRFRQAFGSSLEGGIDWWPGPVMNSESDYDAEASAYDRVWKLTRENIIYHVLHYTEIGYQPIDAIANWPGNGDTSKGQAAQLAPFADRDNDGIYEPLDGDYPLIRGDQAIFFMMNAHRINTSGGFNKLSVPAMKVEVHGMAYVFDCPDDYTVDHTIFLHYDIYNRGDDTYEETWAGVWLDWDLGNAQDDFIASDVMRNAYYVYNGDAFDEDTFNGKGYGSDLGIFGCTLLRGLKTDEDAEDNDWGIGAGFDDNIVDNEHFGLESFMLHQGANGPHGDPIIAQDYYYYLSARFKDGSPLNYGGIGYDPSNQCPFPVRHLYGSNDPLFYSSHGVDPDTVGCADSVWSETSAGNSPADRRGIGSSGPVTFEPGGQLELDAALVFSRSSQDTIGQDHITAFENAVDHVRDIYEAGAFDCGSFEPVSVEDRPGVSTIKIFPNPTDQALTIASPTAVSWKLMDISGRLVAEGNTQQVQTHHLMDGAYLLQISAQGSSTVKRIIVQH